MRPTPLLIILLTSLLFLPFTPFTPVELLAGAAAGLGALSLTNMLSTVKPESSGTEVVYDPREWPKYVAVFLIQATGYILYHRLGHDAPPSSGYLAGIAFIVVVVALPGIVVFVLLVRNRNDRITLTASQLIWKDNEQHGCLNRSDIRSITAVRSRIAGIIPANFIHVELQDGGSASIPAYRMNFTWRDTLRTVDGIRSAISR